MLLLLTIIILSDFALSRILSGLNRRSDSLPVPEEIRDIYPAERRARQIDFNRQSRRLSAISDVINTVAVLAMLLLGGYRWADGIVERVGLAIAHPMLSHYVMALIFFLGLSVAGSLLNLPMAAVRTFGLMQRFGFNRTSKTTFALDRLKGQGMNVLLTALILAVVVPVYDATPEWFWLIAWAGISVISLTINYFYSQLIVPLYNRQTPLEQGSLRTAIEQMATRAGFSLNNIYVMDAGRRTTLANAYFTGWGRRRRIVLYDTLIEQLSEQEIVAVLAHELGHNRHHDTLSAIAASLATSLVTFLLMGLTLRYNLCAGAIGCAASLHVNLYLFYTLYDPIDTLFSLGANAASRRHEYRADAYAATLCPAEDLISGLKKLSAASLSNPTPHPAYVFVHYSHPTLVERIRKLRRL